MRKALPRETGLWARDLPACPACGAPSCYHENSETVECDNLDDACEISPAVTGEIHNARARWDALCAVFTELDIYKSKADKSERERDNLVIANDVLRKNLRDADELVMLRKDDDAAAKWQAELILNNRLASALVGRGRELSECCDIRDSLRAALSEFYHDATPPNLPSDPVAMEDLTPANRQAFREAKWSRDVLRRHKIDPKTLIDER